MDKEQDMSSEEHTEQGSGQLGEGTSTTTRRKFNKGAATGAAVLLTLGNQVSWGHGEVCWETKTKRKSKCISAQVWASVGGSYHGKGKKHDKQRAAFQEFLDTNYPVDDVFDVGNPPQTCAIKDVVVEVEVECP